MEIDFTTENFNKFIRDVCYVMTCDAMEPDSAEYKQVAELYATCVRHEYSKTTEDYCVRLGGVYQMLKHVDDPIGILTNYRDRVKDLYMHHISELSKVDGNISFDLEFLTLVMCICGVFNNIK